MAEQNISYLNKDFSDFKANLINYAKTYFPNTHNDFSESSPGSMFIEMAAFVGDVMSFYLDTQVQENLLLHAKEKENIYALAYIFGYTPKASYASSVNIDLYQLIPSVIVGVDSTPNASVYGLLFPENTVLTSSTSNIKFLTLESVDFTDLSDAEVTFVDTNYYLVRKSVKAMSAEVKTTSFNFTSPEKFQSVVINDSNILQIIDVEDSSTNKWYEVPYLAQSTIFTKIANPDFTTDQVPYLMQLQKVPRRFVSRLLSDGSLKLEFGAGISSSSDSVILPDPDNIGLGLVPGISLLDQNYNKASLFFTKEYGIAPSNTTLTVTYLVGGGINSNVPSNDITTITSSLTTSNFKNGTPGNSGVATYVLNSIACNNELPASGGRGGDEVEEVRNNALYSYSSQLRAVTKDDYMIRALSLLPEFGNIAKVYVTQDLINETSSETVSYNKVNNPLALDLYVLAYNSNKQIVTPNITLKENLVTYINRFRVSTDAINIKNAFYINIGINFDITVESGYNNNDVITNCILTLQNYFNIDKWNINQPIILSEINSSLLKVKGVQSVVKIEIINKQDDTETTYSKYGYDISAATSRGVIYPSLDPSIFEVRYPSTDIQGRVVSN